MIWKNKAMVLCVCLLSVVSCSDRTMEGSYESRLQKSDLLLKSLDNLTEIIVHDIFSPPVASRVYVYPCVAAYEILALNDNELRPLAGQLNGMDSIPKASEEVSAALAAVHAFNLVGKALIFSEAKMDEFTEDLSIRLDTFGIPRKIRENSKNYASEVSQFILAWADEDNYKESRSMPKHPISDEAGKWKPTPPAYMEGIEPHWREIRPMVIESATQFRPEAPPSFELSEDSDFYKKTMEVYDAVNNANEEERLIASFWDCNPYVMNQTGHVMIATKKITPGGHWMGIASLSALKAGVDMSSSAEILTICAIALFDGFISCWDEKYRSNLIRPETVINEHIDASWQPILQTPPFPEHTSGHSVISRAAAETLTSVLGDNFEFIDDVETKYGLPRREFNSFFEASDEAAISRLYGGIHYRPAIDEGVKQGSALGQYIIEEIDFRETQN